MSKQLAHHIINALTKNKFEAYMVGGCVRDQLLKKTPKDWDVCTSARPEQIQSIFPDAQLVGAKFGVCLVRRDHEQVEVATFRAEGAYSDHRRPDEVHFVKTANEDVKRRDLTINGLLMGSNGKVIDLVNGCKDLNNRLIRTIGKPEDRFGEDYLRMMRAVRFAGRLEFRMTDEVVDTIARMGYSIREIAAERVREELHLMLLGPNPGQTMELLREVGLHYYLCYEFALMHGCNQPQQYHPEGDVWTHTRLMLDGHSMWGYRRGNQPDLAVMLAALLHDTGKPATFTVEERIKFPGHEEVSAKIAEEFLAKYKYSNEMREKVVWMVANHMRINRLAEMKKAKQMRMLQSPHFADLLELHRLDCWHSNQDMSTYNFAKELFEKTPLEEVRPTPFLNGHDVMREFSIPAGPLVGRILKHVAELQLNGEIKTRREALEAATEVMQAVEMEEDIAKAYEAEDLEEIAESAEAEAFEDAGQ
jgi:poly(A) polymerase